VWSTAALIPDVLESRPELETQAFLPSSLSRALEPVLAFATAFSEKCLSDRGEPFAQ
jgi:hypothetical protein